MNTLQMQQFDTGNSSEVRGQFETWAGAWSWGKDEDGFWAECIEVFDEDDAYGFADMRVSNRSLREVLINVSDLHCGDWASAVITHDNGKKRTVKLRSL